MTNTINVNTLNSDEYAMYKTSKLKVDAARERYEMLAHLPPFAFDEKGNKSKLMGEFLKDIRDEISQIDEEDFITDRYTPLPGVTKKYKSQIEMAAKIRAADKNLGVALKKWFEENNLTMDESIAFSYGV